MTKSNYNLRQASTVILAREDRGELQIYLLRRSGRSAFMPGNYVFPGGQVDPGDRDQVFCKSLVGVLT